MGNRFASFGGGFASGMKGGMEMAKRIREMMARKAVDDAAAAKASAFEAKPKGDNSGILNTPLGGAAPVAPSAAPSASPSAAGAEVLPVAEQAPVDQKPLDMNDFQAGWDTPEPAVAKQPDWQENFNGTGE